MENDEKPEVLGYGSHSRIVKLTDADLAAIAKDHARTGEEIEALAAERKAINAKLADKRGHRAELDQQTRQGHREEVLAVRYEAAPGLQVRIVDDLTGEELALRAMTAAEREGRHGFASTPKRGSALACAERIGSGLPMLPEDVPLLDAAKGLVIGTIPDVVDAVGLSTDADAVLVALAWERAGERRKKVLAALAERAHELGVGEAPDEDDD